MNALGLGTNSTILNVLKSTGRIASRTWSMFWGRDGAARTSQLDGIMVLGGYDKAKVAGKKVVQPLTTTNPACPSQLVVTITDIVLNFSNGTDASIFPASASAALQACIVPDYPVLMTLPLDPFFGNFQLLTGTNITDRSFGINFFGMRYSAGSRPYTGDLTIRLQSGLSVRVPNDQLVVPSRRLDLVSGAIIIDDSSTNTGGSLGPDLVLNSIQNVNANDMVQLGRQFLSAAVLMVNIDSGEFTLWQANPTADSALIAVDARGTELAAEPFCGEDSTASAGVGGASGSPSSLPPSRGPDGAATTGVGGVSTGMVAAIVASVAAVLGLSSVAVFVLIRRRRRRETSPSDTALVDHQPKYPEQDVSYEVQGYPKAELVGSKRGSEFWHRMSSLGKATGNPRELEGSSKHLYELQG